MTWFRLIKTVLAILHVVASHAREQKLMNAGEARATAKSLALLAERLGISRQLRAEVEALSDSELDAELRGDR